MKVKLLSQVIFFLIISTGYAYAFSDVSEDAYYEDALRWAVSEEIIDNGEYFRPSDPVNRAEMAKMVVQGLDMSVQGASLPSFLDVAPGAWYYDFVETGKSEGLFDGYSDADGFYTGFFGPTDFVTRAAVSKVLSQAYDMEYSACSHTFPDVDYGAWYASFIDTMCSAGILKGDIFGRARPADNVNRAEFITMLYRAAGEPYVMTEEDMQVVPMPGIAPEFDLDLVPELEVDVLPGVEEAAPAPVPNQPEPILPEVNFPDFDARTYNNFGRLQAPTGTCSDGSCAVHVAQFEIRPIFDNIRLRRLTFRNDDNSQDFTGRFGTFFLVHEGRVIDTASFNGSSSVDGTVDFDGFDHVLEEEIRHKLNVLAEIHDVTRADQSGSFIKLYVENNGAIEAISDTNGFEISGGSITTDAGPTGPYIQNHIVRKSYPLIQYANENISQTITGPVTNRQVYKFTMSAHPNGDIEWKHLTFDITESSGLTSSNYKLYVENSSNPINSGASVSGGAVKIDLANPHQIPAGQTVTYILKTDIALSNTAQSQNLDITLRSSSDTSLVTDTASSLSSSDFLWSDRSARSHSLSSADWTNGFEVDTLSTETVHIGYQGVGS